VYTNMLVLASSGVILGIGDWVAQEHMY